VCVAVQARLSSRQRRFLLDRGYLVVRSQLDQAVLARIGDRLEELLRQTVAAWAGDPSLDTTEACVVAEFDVADREGTPALPPVISIRCSLTRRLSCLVTAGRCGVWTCGRPSPGRVSRACTPTTP